VNSDCFADLTVVGFAARFAVLDAVVLDAVGFFSIFAMMNLLALLQAVYVQDARHKSKMRSL